MDKQAIAYTVYVPFTDGYHALPTPVIADTASYDWRGRIVLKCAGKVVGLVPKGGVVMAIFNEKTKPTLEGRVTKY
ncbi:MAG: hypothetical protein ACRC3K_10210 [Plesiomonas sp.]